MRVGIEHGRGTQVRQLRIEGKTLYITAMASKNALTGRAAVSTLSWTRWSSASAAVRANTQLQRRFVNRVAAMIGSVPEVGRARTHQAQQIKLTRCRFEPDGSTQLLDVSGEPAERSSVALASSSLHAPQRGEEAIRVYAKLRPGPNLGSSSE